MDPTTDLLRVAPLHRLTRAAYEEMVRLGLFEDQRVELLHGVIVDMSPQYPSHSSPIELLTELFAARTAGRYRLRVQSPYAAADESEPEPDLALVAREDHSEEHPRRAFLLVEVADSSLVKDLLVKAPLYAASNVEEYWVVDVNAREVIVHRGASPTGWTSVTRHPHGATLTVAAFPDVAIAIADFLR